MHGCTFAFLRLVHMLCFLYPQHKVDAEGYDRHVVCLTGGFFVEDKFCIS